MNFKIEFGNQTTVKDLKLSPYRTIYALDLVGKEITLPSFIKYKNDGFVVTNPGISDFGIYTVGLTIGYAEYPGYEINCGKELKVDYIIKFEGDVATKLVITCGKEAKLVVPEFKDAFG